MTSAALLLAIEGLAFSPLPDGWKDSSLDTSLQLLGQRLDIIDQNLDRIFRVCYAEADKGALDTASSQDIIYLEVMYDSIDDVFREALRKKEDILGAPQRAGSEAQRQLVLVMMQLASECGGKLLTTVVPVIQGVNLPTEKANLVEESSRLMATCQKLVTLDQAFGDKLNDQRILIKDHYIRLRTRFQGLDGSLDHPSSQIPKHHLGTDLDTLIPYELLREDEEAMASVRPPSFPTAPTGPAALRSLRDQEQSLDRAWANDLRPGDTEETEET